MLRPQYLARAQPGESAYFVALKEYLNAHKTSNKITSSNESGQAALRPVLKIAEINLQIAKFNTIAANNMLIDQRIAIFANQSLNCTSYKAP